MNKTMAGVTLAAVIFAFGAQAQGAREDEGPIGIEKCQTISQPGSYRLVNNLTFTSSSGTCLTITANFVTIDLAGLTISSPGQQIPENEFSTLAIAAGTDTTSITVRNGSISGFGIGVSLEGDGSIVEELRVGGPGLRGAGIIASGIVRGNVVSVLGAPSLCCVGIRATGIVSGNYVFNSSSVGIEVGQGSTVIGNTVTGTAIGLRVACPSNATNNTAVNNRVRNLELDGNGCNNTNNVNRHRTRTLHDFGLSV